MNNTNIKSLLEKYWDGNTSLKEEHILKEFFLDKDIDPAYEADRLIFKSFLAQKSKTMRTHYDANHWASLAQSIPTESKILDLRKWAVAASCVILLGLGGFIIQQQWYDMDNSTVASAEEALEESEKAILFLAEHFGKGQRATTEIKHLETLGNTIQ